MEKSAISRLLASILTLCVAAPAASNLQPRDDALATLPVRELLTRAAAYVRRVEREMSTVVMEEGYVQVVKPWTFPPRTPDLPHLLWLQDLSAERPDVIVKLRRQTRSDVLLVQVPDQRWTAFRDTFEVNGREQHHRDDRLRKLFLQQSQDGRRQLRRIHERSAEWNLGGFYREINLPTTGLLVAHRQHQERFAFASEGLEHRGAITCRLLSFTEIAKPTLVQSLRGGPVPLSGHLCIDEAGAVWSTRLDLDPRYTMRGVIEVTYAQHERVDVLVPERMWEWYELPEPDGHGFPLYLEALATYSHLRRFTVTTEETVKE